MLKIGLTGGIGSGKTSISNLFKAMGTPVIDADTIAHKLVNNNPEILHKITNAFGRDILNLDGKLNRKKLAQIIFNVKKNKQQLEDILHPKIKQKILDKLHHLASARKPPDYVIIAVPLLIEVNYSNFVDRILVVIAEKNKRVSRVQQRDGKSLNEILSIINNQTSDEARQKKADDIIENNDDIKSLIAQVQKLHENYLQLSTSME